MLANSLITILVLWSVWYVLRTVAPNVTYRLMLKLADSSAQLGWNGLARRLRPLPPAGCGGGCGCGPQATNAARPQPDGSVAASDSAPQPVKWK